MSIVSMYSDLHPYECGQDCVHCTNPITGDHSLNECAFCWDDFLATLGITDFNVYPARQLYSHGPYDVTHRGQEYCVFTEGEAATEYLRDRWVPFYFDNPAPDIGIVGQVITYQFRLTGAHGGPPMEVLMVYPRDEDDGEGGRDFVWDVLRWADDLTLFDHEYFLDAYTDPLRDELTTIAKETWD